jgi:hypothetical protein
VWLLPQILLYLFRKFLDDRLALFVVVNDLLH